MVCLKITAMGFEDARDMEIASSPEEGIQIIVICRLQPTT
jgi:hypothetical protein